MLNHKAIRRPLRNVLDEHTAAHVADLFGAFGDTSRVRIISVLAQAETSVGDVAAAVGLSESAVSHHLRSLRQLRLVHVRRDGRRAFYLLDEHLVLLFKHGLEHVHHG